MTPDSELLRQFARTNSEDAFAELVRRHVNLVYSAALRQVNGDAHLAEDVAQIVFIDLACKAGSLARRDSLTGWLYTSAHYAAAKVVRTETRRREREEKFMREPTNASPLDASRAEALAEAGWDEIRPALDDAMHELKQSDREAILLRYFENQPFAEVGEKLGLNENAARMRVERALGKLRAIFANRGITAAAALTSAISANAVQLAPANLAATLTSVSITSAGAGTFTLMKILTATKLKLGVSALAVAGAATALVVQHQTQTHLRDESELLHRQIAQLQTDNQNLSNQLAVSGQTKSLTDEQLNELLRLRSEVGMLRQQTNQLTYLQAKNRQLQLQANEMQQQALENFPVLTNVLAFNAHRVALVNAGKIIGIAMRIFAGNHGGAYPTNLEQIPFNIEDLPVTNFNGGIELSDFEMVNTGLASEQIPQIPAVKERQPRWWDGKWERIYVMDDGAVQLITSDNGDFSAWEKKQLTLALGATNQNQ